MLRILAVILLLGTVGCSQSSWDNPGPRETFENFLISRSQNDTEAMFNHIWKEDRETLKSSVESLENIPENVRPAPHEMLVVAGMDHPYDIERTRLQDKIDGEPSEGQRVVIELFYLDGREGQATMIWGGDGWYVDLPLEAARDKAKETSDG